METLLSEDCPRAMRHRSVGRVLHLHALLYHCNNLAACLSSDAGLCIPSNGFISASLAMVAEAPLTATWRLIHYVAKMYPCVLPAAKGW